MFFLVLICIVYCILKWWYREYVNKSIAGIFVSSSHDKYLLGKLDCI